MCQFAIVQAACQQYVNVCGTVNVAELPRCGLARVRLCERGHLRSCLKHTSPCAMTRDKHAPGGLLAKSRWSGGGARPNVSAPRGLMG